MPSIVKCFSNPNNRFITCSLADNQFTSLSLIILSPILKKHKYIRCLYFNNNDIGDEGASLLIEALCDAGIIEELNLSNCGIINCNWANILQKMSTLSILNLSRNLINDAGCLDLCEGVERCLCLRYLDLSNNRYLYPVSATLCTYVFLYVSLIVWY